MLDDKILTEYLASGVKLTDIIKEAASEVISRMFLLEAKGFVDNHKDLRLEDGRQRIVFTDFIRNGKSSQRGDPSASACPGSGTGREKAATG
jgi:hypothetical protein